MKLNRFRSTLRALSPTCRDAARQCSHSLDHPLSPPEHLGLVLHLTLCTSCRRFNRQLGILSRVMKALETADVASDDLPPLPPASRARIAQRLRRIEE